MVALGLSAVAALAVWLLFQRPDHPVWWGVAWLLGVNGVAFLAYGLDKHQARSARRRIPERALHVLAVAGGSFGAYCGMRWFRHKTLKGRFRLVFWIIIVAQLMAAAVLAYWLCGAGRDRETS